MEKATEPSVPVRAATPLPPAEHRAARAEAGDDLKTYLARRAARAPAEEIKKIEATLQEKLALLPPPDAVDLLFESRAPAVIFFLLARVDRGLLEDRAVWEQALVVGLEKIASDPARLGEFGEVVESLVTDPEAREQAARLLMKSAKSDALLALTGRFAAGETVPDVRDFLWSKVPAPGAVEGLGHVVGPEEAPALEALGPYPHVLRALETAHARTRDAAFRRSLAHLGR